MSDEKTVLDAARDDDIYVWSSYSKDEPDEGESLRYGDLKPIVRSNVDKDDIVFVMPGEAGGSDYSGGTHNKANFKAMINDFGDDPDVHEVYGGHGTFAFAVRARSTNEPLIEAIEALQDYPIYDEEAWSQYELELQEEALENWALDDFVRAMTRLYDEVEGWEEAVEGLRDAGAISWGFHDFAENANEYWEGDGPDVFIRVEKIADETAPGALFDTGDYHRGWRGWVGAGLVDTTKELTDLFDRFVPGITQVKGGDGYNRRVRAIIDGLYDEGIQPKYALGPVSDWSLLKDLQAVGIAPQQVLDLADALGKDASAESRYQELANRFLILDDAYTFAHESVTRFPTDAEEDAEFVANNYQIVIEAMGRIAQDKDNKPLDAWLAANTRTRKAG